MKDGDTVKVIASSHSDVPTGCVGVIKSALGIGYGVTFTAEFFIPGVVPFRRVETRTIWFPGSHLEVIPQPLHSACDTPIVCAIDTEIYGAQGCASCDQALVRPGE